MGAREAKVEQRLHREVKKLGGTTRKWVSPGVDGVPDRIVFLNNMIILVEIKTVDGKLSSAQKREHARLAEHGAPPITLFGAEDVDKFVAALKEKCG